MNWLGIRFIEIADLALPADFADRLKSPRVLRLAPSLKLTGARPIHLPTVEIDTLVLIAGGDRVAATVVNGEDRIECQMWEGTPDELMLVRRTENALRRAPDPTDVTALVDLTARVLAFQEPSESDEPRGPGRPQTERGRAREAVAAATGLSPDTVARRDRQPAPPAPPPVVVFPLPTWGHGVPNEELAGLTRAMKVLEGVEQRLETCQVMATGLKDNSSDYGRRLAQRIAVIAKDAWNLVRSSAPVALCPKCGFGIHMPRCQVCRGSGWLNKATMDSLPRDSFPKPVPKVEEDEEPL